MSFPRKRESRINAINKVINSRVRGDDKNKMFAVIKTGGKQYIVKPGDKIKIEKLEKQEGDSVVFSEVLLVSDDEKTEIGTPTVKAEVEAKVLKQGKADKVIVFKYKSKKRYSRRIGHRQPYTEVEITSIK
jgi:large subunit ribosomal protein L21